MQRDFKPKQKQNVCVLNIGKKEWKDQIRADIIEASHIEALNYPPIDQTHHDSPIFSAERGRKKWTPDQQFMGRVHQQQV